MSEIFPWRQIPVTKGLKPFSHIHLQGRGICVDLCVCGNKTSSSTSYVRNNYCWQTTSIVDNILNSARNSCQKTSDVVCFKNPFKCKVAWSCLPKLSYFSPSLGDFYILWTYNVTRVHYPLTSRQLYMDFAYFSPEGWLHWCLWRQLWQESSWLWQDINVFCWS